MERTYTPNDTIRPIHLGDYLWGWGSDSREILILISRPTDYSI